MLSISIPKEFRNRFFFILFLLFSLIFFSCSEETINKKKGITIKNGIVYELGTNQTYTGKVTDTLSGQIMSYEVVDGIKNGKFSVKDLNGKTIMEGLLKNNKNEGKWRYYYPNGKLESEGDFVSDTVEGKWSWYYEDGIIKEEGFFKNGKREGVWILYDKEGKVKSTMNFKKGTKISENIQNNFFAGIIADRQTGIN